PHVRRRRVRVARGGVLDVRGDERRDGARGRACRVDVQPQLRGTPGQGRAHAPDVAGHGRRGGGDGSRDRRPGAGGLTVRAFTRVTGVAAPIDLPNIDTDRVIPARFLRKPQGSPGYERFLFH